MIDLERVVYVCPIFKQSLVAPGGPVPPRPTRRVDPGALTAGDLSDVAASLAPRPLRMEGLVDGLDRAVRAIDLARVMEPARSAYRALDGGDHLRLGEVDAENPPLARWILDSLVADPAP